MNEETTVKVGIAGAGRQGVAYIGEFDALDRCAVAWVCETNFSRLMDIQEQFPYLRVTATYDDLLQDPSLDAVVVASPLERRYELALAALQAGKHVLVHAPLAIDVGQADALVATAGACGLVLGSGHLDLYHPAVAEIKSLLEQDQIGELCYLESTSIRPAPADARLDVTWNLAASDVAIALHLAGERPVAVVAIGRDFVTPTLVDTAFITIRYESGRFSQHHVSWLAPRQVRRFSVAGRRGAIDFNEDRAKNTLRLFSSTLDLAGQEAAPALVLDLDNMLMSHLETASLSRRACAHFLDSVRTGRQPEADGALGRDVVRVLAAASDSIRQGAALVSLEIRD
ncbi:MAG: Gfo/Idh/MocA family oxidoreductase [Chloroflexi bacterium]|nr:Gfo/Idh/MocA family oxidoreductase [Chloroflexota bacterium]MCI0577751.1 Gfo/Idh/MocA family oxidoreductase [Chloroflexota bacterium]MCI0644657.1 Gfo/Idh/MocA family oxidoreductase [Chloroflexota bacterium]MCI0728041.1 Gfo/Idh/MocA family oxidoreductase [Chloroflexota bacterium]